MEQFETALQGATELAPARNNIAVPNGWRKPTPGLMQADRYADAGATLDIPKGRAIVAVKKVAAAIGLKSQDLLLLDTFGAMTQPQDWAAGQRPIVWASNNFLMEQTGFSLATLRRHVRRLYDLGVIAMKDSPNGKRWGRRDADGLIVEAYGFDLGPMAARTTEFETLYAELQADRAERATLRNAITVTRRIIRAKLESAQASGLPEAWHGLKDAFRALLEGLPGRSEGVGGLEAFLGRLRALLRAVDAMFVQTTLESKEAPHLPPEVHDDELVSEKVTPRRLKNETHIRTTQKHQFVESSAREDDQTETGAHQQKHGAPCEGLDRENGHISWSTHSRTKPSDIDVPMLMASCPHFADLAKPDGGYLQDWSDVHRAATALHPMVGISTDAWRVANQVMGPVGAAASLALILDKTATGEVKSPGGYLRGMVQKAGAGELHLERSFYGRMQASAA